MLSSEPDELAKTDVADHALEVLREAGVKEVVVLGRRGPAQAAFTNPELLELDEMTDADVVVSPDDCELDPDSARLPCPGARDQDGEAREQDHTEQASPPTRRAHAQRHADG